LPSLTPIGIPFIELPAVESTNNYAMGLVREGMAQHGTAVFAHDQTRGKGQRNRQWLSEPGQNIALSVIVEPVGLESSKIFLLSMTAALATLDFFNKFAGDEFKIKWPNDVYWRDRKAAGILIENLWQQERWKYAIIGIGININQTSFGDLGTKAVSLKQITGKSFNTADLARELCHHLQLRLEQLNENPDEIIESYQNVLYKKGEQVRFKKSNRIFDARIDKVTEQGELVVTHFTEEAFSVGEVEWIPDNGF
jgi:BirA family biotin operon repressor/biotin-[acetyl-CoA-carboxylase] ligase